jgi:hypothetical protein
VPTSGSGSSRPTSVAGSTSSSSAEPKVPASAGPPSGSPYERSPRLEGGRREEAVVVDVVPQARRLLDRHPHAAVVVLDRTARHLREHPIDQGERDAPCRGADVGHHDEGFGLQPVPASSGRECGRAEVEEVGEEHRRPDQGHLVVAIGGPPAELGPLERGVELAEVGERRDVVDQLLERVEVVPQRPGDHHRPRPGDGRDGELHEPPTGRLGDVVAVVGHGAGTRRGCCPARAARPQP